jgi:hypothetical protein
MAEYGSWGNIERHGLLSTQALTDLFEVNDDARERILRQRRPECVAISHPQMGEAVVRDQKPMDDPGLRRALRDGLTPRDWYAIINAKVFFWLTEARLQRLRLAKPYAKKRQTILIVDTQELLARHGERVVLSPINSGCTKPMPHPRGRDTFLPLERYPFDAWDRKRRGKDPIVELAVSDSVPDIHALVIEAVEEGGGEPTKVLYSR